VISLGQDGQISSQGTLSEALKSNKALIKEVNTEEVEVTKADETIDDVLPEIPEGKVDHQGRDHRRARQLVSQYV